jgi:hypothetical protein
MDAEVVVLRILTWGLGLPNQLELGRGIGMKPGLRVDNDVMFRSLSRRALAKWSQPWP